MNIIEEEEIEIFNQFNGNNILKDPSLYIKKWLYLTYGLLSIGISDNYLKNAVNEIQNNDDIKFLFWKREHDYEI